MALITSSLLFLLLSLVALVSAHGDGDHSAMPGMEDGDDETMGMMKM